MLRQIYMKRRSIVQLTNACARYDEELTYTLKPGECLFENVEFSTVLRVNRLGLRDDESSLAAPRIIVLGDSLAMGWGVAQAETFSQLLESSTGLRVLNAAISSYGTVRELRLLERLDRSALEVLVVQYCDNDVRENWKYLDRGNRLVTIGREDYRRMVAGHEQASGYWPGHFLLPKLKRGLLELRDGFGQRGRSPAAAHEAEDEAELFLNVLTSNAVGLDGLRIVLLEINSFGANDSVFLDSVRARLESKAGAPSFELEILDLSRRLDPERHYYRLDDHLNAAGHRLVAEALRSTRSIRAAATRPQDSKPSMVSRIAGETP